MALRDIGLPPGEFWTLTPGALALLVEGRRARERAEWYRTAWLACAVRASVWATEGVTPYGLLGWDDPTADAAADAAVNEHRWAEVLAILAPQQAQVGS